MVSLSAFLTTVNSRRGAEHAGKNFAKTAQFFGFALRSDAEKNFLLLYSAISAPLRELYLF
jgi:hypothetical protein